LGAGGVVEESEGWRPMQRREKRANGFNREIQTKLRVKFCLQNILRFGLQTLAPE
jgi:hypothetical protein